MPLLAMTSLLCVSFFLFLVLVAGADAGGEKKAAAGSKPWMDTGGLSRAAFPAGFTFGTAASAYQVEGMAHKDGRGPSIWDNFVKIPGQIANNATGDVTVDEYHRYKEDVDIMKKMNFDAYRFSISWSRIFPEGAGRVNWKGVAYYNRLIDYLIQQDITPYANLYHYDLPEALEKKYNGLLSKQIVEDFANYADFCFKVFGDRVKYWMTFNEPRVVAALGYDDGIFAPGRCSNCSAGNSATEPYIVAHNLILSHAAAVRRYREKYQARQKGRIGILLDFVWYEPLTDSKDDQDAAQRSRDFHIGWFLHPIIYGEYPKSMQMIVRERLPRFTEEEIKIVKGSIDYVGINQYTAYYISNPQLPNQGKPTRYQSDWNAQFWYERNGVPIGPRAHSTWLYIVPWGMYKAVTYVKEHYGNPVVILSENGMDDPGNVTLRQGLHDTVRIDYYRSYISQLKRAIDDGAHVIGYFAWSLLDNFEWRSGYTSRFGLVYIDYKTLRRYPKMSAYWFRQMLQREGMDGATGDPRGNRKATTARQGDRDHDGDEEEEIKQFYALIGKIREIKESLSGSTTTAPKRSRAAPTLWMLAFKMEDFQHRGESESSAAAAEEEEEKRRKEEHSSRLELNLSL